jgi:hypothetical protein
MTGWDYFWISVGSILVAAVISAAFRSVWKGRGAVSDWFGRPELTAGPTQFSFTEGSNKASLKVVNRGRRGTFHASIDKVHHFRLATGHVFVAGALTPPWQVPWCPGDGWEQGPGQSGGERELLRKQSGLLCIGWFVMKGTTPRTFSLYGVKQKIPYDCRGGYRIQEFATVLRLFNSDAGRSWAWDVTFIFSPDAIDPEVQIKRSR